MKRKICKTCGKMKVLTKFPAKTCNKDGRTNKCRICSSTKKNPKNPKGYKAPMGLVYWRIDSQNRPLFRVPGEDKVYCFIDVIYGANTTREHILIDIKLGAFDQAALFCKRDIGNGEGHITYHLKSERYYLIEQED